MQDSITIFETELEVLLKQYFAEEDLNQMKLKVNPPKNEDNDVSEKINDFYRNQLDINLDSFQFFNYRFTCFIFLMAS